MCQRIFSGESYGINLLTDGEVIGKSFLIISDKLLGFSTDHMHSLQNCELIFI